MTRKIHMSANIEGILRNYKGRKITFLDNDKGKRMTDKDARSELAKLQALGHKLIPCSDECEGFDPFGGGCPGHPERLKEEGEKLKRKQE